MKTLILAFAAICLSAGIVAADKLPLNGQRGAPINVPTGVEVKGATDYKLKANGEVKQLTGQKKINADMLKGTLAPTGQHDG